MPFHPMALFATVPIVALTLGFVYAVRVSSEPEPSDSAAEEPEKRTRWERARRTGYWASSIVLAVVFILTGVPKLSTFGGLLHRFNEWGYPEGFMMFIGISEFFAGILLIPKSTSFYAASYLGAIMVGAIYTHIAFDPAIWVLLPAFCLSFLFFIGYEDLQRMKSSAARSASPSVT